MNGGLNTYGYVNGNPLGWIDPFGLSKFDKFYGLPKNFWNWYHRKVKKNGDPDLDKKDARELHKEWKSMGKPGPDKKQRDQADMEMIMWLFPWQLHLLINPTGMGCSSFDCNNNGIPDAKEMEENPCSQG